ncbi:MAG TPA: M48 family metalloprotease [Spirochaetota bacterium]|nr:M48 family metalloprotease [Spirochaetota bacterium]HQE59886.1 M48 family metalloprotease [Spirochaetota bacterium]
MNRFFTITLLLLASCAQQQKIDNVMSDKYKLEEDEKRIWARSAEEQEVIEESGFIYEDKEANEYVNKVALSLFDKTVHGKIKFSIRILKNPYSNAFAYPNGVIYIHTGMLARIENEAQLATLLAHEMTHITHRHALSGFRNLKSKSIYIAAVGNLGASASINGYSRICENEADTEGFRLMVKAGYSPNEATQIFSHIKDELSEENLNEPFAYGTHPHLQDRINNYKNLIAGLADKHGRATNERIYRNKISRLLIDNSTLDIEAGRFVTAEKTIDKYISFFPSKCEGYYLKGKLIYQKGSEADTAKALLFFEKSVSLNSSYAEPYKEIGYINFKLNNKKKASAAFKKYLSLKPNAQDSEYIKEYINQCN